jgi:hypothetical protein
MMRFRQDVLHKGFGLLLRCRSSDGSLLRQCGVARGIGEALALGSSDQFPLPLAGEVEMD